MNESRLLVIQVAALGHDLVKNADEIAGMTLRPMQPAFPAVTCTAQASFRTAASAGVHGMVGNGFYCSELLRPMFWEQSSKLVAGERIWKKSRERGRRVGMMFWQQSLGEDVDLVVSPAPIHKHHGGMIQDCYAKPDGLYRRLCDALGGTFKLKHYWGPLASAKVGDWIVEATAFVMRTPDLATDLLLTYLPSLDYDLQRYGPRDARSLKALERTKEQITTLVDAAKKNEYDVVLFGDYAIGEVSRTLSPNRILRDAGMMSTREVRGMQYPDFYASRAFAVVDHEVAHVHVKDATDLEPTKQALADVGELLDKSGQEARGVAHRRSGDLLLIAEPGSWFAYPWWTDPREAPEYATHVDIHNKPGYDPCELFFGRWPWQTGQDASRIRGSHGRIGPDRTSAWGASYALDRNIATLIDVAEAVQSRLDEQT